MAKGGCAYGQVNRQMIDDMKSDIADIKKGQNDISAKITDLFNHQSTRVPPWVLILFSLGSAVITGLAVFIITH